MTEERYAAVKDMAIRNPHFPNAMKELAAYCDELRERVRQLEAELKACRDTLPGPYADPIKVGPKPMRFDHYDDF